MTAVYVYILRCADGALYVGHTGDTGARLAAHNSGTAALFTRRRLPVTLAFSEAHPTKASAVRRERQLKRWRRDKKEALIEGDLVRLKRL